MNATTANHTEAAAKLAVGDGMTLCYPQDRYPFVVVRVSDSGKTAWVKPLEIVDLSTGHEPDRFDGNFPVWSHSYTEEERQSMVQEDAPERMVRLTKRGWASKGTPFTAGAARYHRNYSY